ncbi:hypothetical protein PR048_010585 [Dryococelus australis]|uniref:Uncharacterized protein n=1 Tax=Dryococelus australis TaxID=614101 RepID=A0ABQ9I366_9NEOP|nr:hypothetical protein PR048_010585 [Dryococelus australis]
MSVIKVSMEQRRNEGAGEMGDPRENPPTNGIVRHDSHMKKSGVTPRPGIEPGRMVPETWRRIQKLFKRPPFRDSRLIGYSVQREFPYWLKCRLYGVRLNCVELMVGYVRFSLFLPLPLFALMKKVAGCTGMLKMCNSDGNAGRGNGARGEVGRATKGVVEGAPEGKLGRGGDALRLYSLPRRAAIPLSVSLAVLGKGGQARAAARRRLLPTSVAPRPLCESRGGATETDTTHTPERQDSLVFEPRPRQWHGLTDTTTTTTTADSAAETLADLDREAIRRWVEQASAAVTTTGGGGGGGGGVAANNNNTIIEAGGGVKAAAAGGGWWWRAWPAPAPAPASPPPPRHDDQPLDFSTHRHVAAAAAVFAAESSSSGGGGSSEDEGVAQSPGPLRGEGKPPPTTCCAPTVK